MPFGLLPFAFCPFAFASFTPFVVFWFYFAITAGSSEAGGNGSQQRPPSTQAPRRKHLPGGWLAAAAAAAADTTRSLEPKDFERASKQASKRAAQQNQPKKEIVFTITYPVCVTKAGCFLGGGEGEKGSGEGKWRAKRSDGPRFPSPPGRRRHTPSPSSPHTEREQRKCMDARMC